MNKIIVLVYEKYIVFNKYDKKISSDNLNNTNVINTKNLKFTEEYIIDNLDIVTAFFKLLILKNNIKTVYIKSTVIGSSVIKIINGIENINTVIFTEDIILNYTICSLLSENKNLIEINCYNMPQLMFYKFKKDIVKTRSTLQVTSNFLEYNKINTYSKIYNKDKIVIKEPLTFNDVDDIIDFFNINKNLKKIDYIGYKKENLKAIVKLLHERNKNNIAINIYEEQSVTKNIIEDIPELRIISKNNNIKININYSSTYKKKNKIKELNYKMIKIITVSFVCLMLLLILFSSIIKNKGTKTTNKSIEEIKETVTKEKKSEEDNYVSEKGDKEVKTVKNTTREYSELKKINSDTVGWLTVKNTRIDYPVVQAKNNEYYLNNSFNKNKSVNGWIYADYRNNMDNLDKNTIIYGHSMLLDKTMFTTLTNVLNSNWYNNPSNLNIIFSIKGNNYNFKIFSIYTIKETSDYLYTNFNSDEEYFKFINMLKGRSIKNFNTDVSVNDNILTLSTCYKSSDYRLVVHAKIIR